MAGVTGGPHEKDNVPDVVIGGLLLSSAFPLQAQMSPVSGPGSMERRPVREPGRSRRISNNR